jgi:hypothetical protein
VNAPAAKKPAAQKLNEVQPGIAYLNSRRNEYLVPFPDKDGRTIFPAMHPYPDRQRIGNGQKCPFTTDSVLSLKINLKQIAETTQKFVHYKYLKVDKIYRNPRGI